MHSHIFEEGYVLSEPVSSTYRQTCDSNKEMSDANIALS